MRHQSNLVKFIKHNISIDTIRARYRSMFLAKTETTQLKTKTSSKHFTIQPGFKEQQVIFCIDLTFYLAKNQTNGNSILCNSKLVDT